MEAQTKSSTQSAAPGDGTIWPGASATEKLLSLVANGKASEFPSPGATRTSGALVAIRSRAGMGPLQSECLAKAPKSLLFGTARYQIEGANVFGTLLAGFLSDLARLMTRSDEPVGLLQPGAKEFVWKNLTRSPLKGWLERWLDSPPDLLDDALISEGLRYLHDPDVLSPKLRLLLFAELKSEEVDEAEWRFATERLIPDLPAGVVFIFSGVPESLPLPEDPIHFLPLELPETADETGERRFAYKISALHTDLATSEDRIGLSRFADALARFILHPQTQPPLTMGIHGQWGKGKSSFMEMVDVALVKWSRANRETQRETWDTLTEQCDRFRYAADLSSNEEKENLVQQLQTLRKQKEQFWQAMLQAARHEVLSVRFNAWQFEDAKQIWAGLVSEISKKIESILSWPARLQLHVSYTVHKRKTEILLSLLLPALILLLVAAFPFFSDDLLRRFAEAFSVNGEAFSQFLQKLLPGGAALSLLWLIPWRVYKIVQPVSRRVLSYVQLPSYREHMGFQHQVMQDLQFACAFLHRRYPECKVVVYIDDLDRCSEEKIMELLQAINLILANSRFFVLVGMDTEMIYRAIVSHYASSFEGIDIPPDFPENYLRKILQLSFYLPAITPEGRFAFVSTLFSAAAQEDYQRETRQASDETNQPAPEPAAATGLRIDMAALHKPEDYRIEEVEDAATELQAFEAFKDFLQDNPRELKRLVNVHRLVKILLREEVGAWPEERQRQLVKWLIFSANWPGLVDDAILEIEDNPEAENVLDLLLDKLDVPENARPEWQRIKDFVNTEPVLRAADIDEHFQLAASITQLVHYSPAPKKPDNQRVGFHVAPEKS